MKPKKIVLMFVVAIMVLLGAALMSGCAGLGVSLETEWGKFTYELPEPKGTKK